MDIMTSNEADQAVDSTTTLRHAACLVAVGPGLRRAVGQSWVTLGVVRGLISPTLAEQVHEAMNS
jgi:hypothetical protein